MDIAANGFLGEGLREHFFDVRVFNPHAPTNRGLQLSSCYIATKRAYEQRIGSFVPLVLSVTRGMGRIATTIYN